MRTTTAVFIVFALTLVGCAPDTDSDAEDPGTPAATTAAGTTESPNGTGTETAGEESTAGTESGAELGDPVATRNGSQGSTKLRLELYPISRSGAVVEVNFAVTQLGTKGSTAPLFQVSDLFSDGDFESVDFTGHAIDGVRVIDVQNKKVHFAASDGKGQCVCSRNLSAAFIRTNETMLFSGTFAAPPAAVQTVDVVIPAFGTVTRVPVR